MKYQYNSFDITSDYDWGFIARALGAGGLFLFIVKLLIPGQGWLMLAMLTWQTIHMYVIGRKSMSFRNFDSIDFICGCFALFFFWQAPLAYILIGGLVYLVTGKRSIRR